MARGTSSGYCSRFALRIHRGHMSRDAASRGTLSLLRSTPSSSRSAMTTRQRWVCFGIGVVLGGTLAVALRFSRTPDVSDADPPSVEWTADFPARPDDYVGSQACAECHAELYDAYQGHPMAQSLAPVLQARVIEDYGAAFSGQESPPAEAVQTRTEPAEAIEGQGVRFAATPRLAYEVQRSTDTVLHHEIGLDAEGLVIYDQAVAVDYAVGSGRHGRSYLTARDGLLYVSPISWYTKSQRWDLSPGYLPEDHPRFERLATEPCLQCHAGRVAEPREGFQTVGNLLPKYQDPPFLEHGIGCERCHGPGGRHIDFQRDGEGQDAIVNPASLPPTRREAVCNQCHLHGEQRALRRGRSDRDFRPGDHLNDIWTVLIPDPATTDASHSVSHVEQMRISACYQADPQRLGCATCHDPHQQAPPEAKEDFYRQRCLSCHATEACGDTTAHRNEVADACTRCHMPRQATEDVPHTTQTDHRVLRRPQLTPENPKSPPRSSLPDSWVLFEQDAAPLKPADRDRAIGSGAGGSRTMGGRVVRRSASRRAVERSRPRDGRGRAGLARFGRRPPGGGRPAVRRASLGKSRGARPATAGYAVYAGRSLPPHRAKHRSGVVL